MNLNPARQAPAALAVVAACAVLAACGTQHPASAAHPAHSAQAAAAPATVPSASPTAGPFASWSPVCQQVAADLTAAGYAYVGGGSGWGTPGTDTYGQLEKLGSKFAHLSYVEMNGAGGNQDAQTANDLGDASTGFFKFLPASVWNNSKYHHVMNEVASNRAVNGWDHHYVTPILTDCANGGG